jgi:carbonic anhydrase
MKNLINGLKRFKQDVHLADKDFYEQLGVKQTPQAVFITCADSRVDPNLITQSQPGSLFQVRNVGNMVPRAGSGSAEESALEYAIEVLGTRLVIVCGHSHCGAMKGLQAKDSLRNLPATRQWLRTGEDSLHLAASDAAKFGGADALDTLIRANVVVQLERLKNIPCISSRFATHEIELVGWVYSIETGNVYSYDPFAQQFSLINE